MSLHAQALLQQGLRELGVRRVDPLALDLQTLDRWSPLRPSNRLGQGGRQDVSFEGAAIGQRARKRQEG